jgi:hypothetical protein
MLGWCLQEMLSVTALPTFYTLINKKLFQNLLFAKLYHEFKLLSPQEKPHTRTAAMLLNAAPSQSHYLTF